MTTRDDLTKFANDIVDAIAQHLNSIRLDHHIKQRSDGPYLILEAAEPCERLFRALRAAQERVDAENPFRERAAIQRRQAAPPDRLALPETQLLKATLAASLTVDRYTFGDDFFGRYIQSVLGVESQIVSDANFIVYGRRGSGKSSLLSYAMHKCKSQSLPYAWLDMQAYVERTDDGVIVDILSEVVSQLATFEGASADLTSLRSALQEISAAESAQKLKRLVPRIRNALLALATSLGTISIFIDDLHAVVASLQPRLLAALYSVTRGNRCHLKASAIEQFTRLWDATTNQGLQPPHDAQVLRLDYNLTMPDRSKAHIESILDAHARFCGLPGVSYIVGKGVISRLVWVAAAVPRDALYLFSQAIAKAGAKAQKRISIMSVNSAASEMAEDKLRYMQRDAQGHEAELKLCLETVKAFCVSEKRTNSFLLEIKNDDPFFQHVQSLIALRFVHVLHEGITPHEAGRRYQALMLDYGFYVGVRAARSVELFQAEATAQSVQTLRRLPILTPASQ